LAQVWEAPRTGTRYLLLDEPTTSLDLAHQHSTLEVARRFARHGAGVLAVLHDLNLAAQYADRIVLLKEVRPLALGSPHAVLTPQVIQAAFGMPVRVIPHPSLPCPVIIPDPSHAVPTSKWQCA
jgi:iron complex transport system ATP-binding protein